MLVHIKEILEHSQKHNYAVGAFNIHNIESVLGVAKAAVNLGSPAIIQVSEGAIEYMGLKPITHIVSTVARNIATQVPIALHLDHGKNLTNIFECIRAGFSSVHIDASDLPLDENINASKHVVELAHKKNVWVQGEVGAIIGGHGDLSGRLDDIPLAKFEDVVEFVRETKVDTIAAAVGTAHGVYDNEDVKIDLLRKIINTCKIPFVLHGGSGVDKEIIKTAIKNGVDIINIGSDIKIAFTDTLRKSVKDQPKETDPRKLLKPTIEAVTKVAERQMKLFGSAGQIYKEKIET
ncbi:MAG: class II fructose-bisphosphate aldolase [Patescibacteria group bacterium]|nr:class II fructose-bisphosphate aldolase [Patescibacteria group bacterium]